MKKAIEEAKKIDDEHTKKREANKKAREANVRKESLVQKNPEDYSADEKEAAQAVINNANSATLQAN